MMIIRDEYLAIVKDVMANPEKSVCDLTDVAIRCQELADRQQALQDLATQAQELDMGYASPQTAPAAELTDEQIQEIHELACDCPTILFKEGKETIRTFLKGYKIWKGTR
jgi:hypothetical protein